MLTNPLKSGDMVKIWHGNRGHDYVILGYNQGDRTLSLLKHNCINLDGSIHASTVAAAETGHYPRSYKEIPVDDFVDGQKVASKINRVVGTKILDRVAISSFVRKTLDNSTMRALNGGHQVFAPVGVTDIRDPATFN